MKRKNIVFLMTDQHRHDALGVVNPMIKTPVLDKLAKRGTRYTQGICNCPMCVPSRYSLMTGLYPFQTGIRHNTNMCTNDEMMEAPTLAERLRDAGYKTGGFGKTHWYIGKYFGKDVEVEQSARGFDVRAIRASGDDGTDEDGAVYWGKMDRKSFEINNKENAPFGPGGELMSGYLGGTSQLTKYTCAEGWLTDRALGFLDDEKDSEQPFFMYLSFDAPHPGFNGIDEFEALYDLSDIPDYDYDIPLDILPNNHGEIRPWAQDWMDASPLERKKGKLRYYAMCSMVDWQFGRIIQRLEEMGELDNTVFMFTSDHGDMLGDRVTFSKYSMYEGSVRVPMILAGGKAKEGMIDDRYVELVDVLPTLLDAANIDPAIELAGGSLYGEPVRIGGFSEMHGSGYEGIEKAQTLMWRKKDFKLIVHTKGDAINSTKQIDECACELYDLKSDPKEYKNLYSDEEYRDIVHKMTMELLLHITSITAKWPRKPSGNDFM